MLRVYLIVGLFGLVSCTSLMAQSLQKEVETSQSKRFAAMVSQDTAYLQANISDQLVYIHSNGFTENKLSHLQSIVTGKVKYASFKPIETKVTLLKKHAICTGIVQVSGEYEGMPFQIALHFTAIYKKIKKKWLLERWQSTKVS
jgi:hypothetical protein